MKLPNPFWTYMEKVGGYFQTLYQREEPQTPGLTLATHMDPAKVNEEIPSEVDVEAVVRNLLPHRVGGHTHLRTEHFKQWRREAYPRENLKTPPRMEYWLCLLDILQHMWRTGDIPQKLGWNVLVLIPKGFSNIRGIGLIETLWKVVESLIDTCLHTILQLHDDLHGFRSGRGMGTAIIELKLAQELASIDQSPLFLV